MAAWACFAKRLSGLISVAILVFCSSVFFFLIWNPSQAARLEPLLPILRFLPFLVCVLIFLQNLSAFGLEGERERVNEGEGGRDWEREGEGESFPTSSHDSMGAWACSAKQLRIFLALAILILLFGLLNSSAVNFLGPFFPIPIVVLVLLLKLLGGRKTQEGEEGDVERCERRERKREEREREERERGDLGKQVIAIMKGEAERAHSLVGWTELGVNPYDRTESPDGCINLGIAENRLSLDVLQSWLDSQPQPTAPLLLDDIAGYKDYHGLPIFRHAMAALLDLVLGQGRVKFSPENIIVTSGASAAVELITSCIADVGDAYIIPAPFYSGFVRDVEWRTQVHLEPAYTESSTNFSITKRCLEMAWESARAKKFRPRAVLFSSPWNPIGRTLDRKTLETILNFAREKNLHVISDELYAGSVWDEPKFLSIAEVMSSEQSDVERVHIIYGLAKDLGLPGFRVGVLYSQNEKILGAARRLVRTTSVSTYTQQFLATRLLSNPTFLDEYFRENCRRLKAAREKVLGAARRAGLKVAEGNSGQYVWLNVSAKNKESDRGNCDRTKEISMFKRLVYECGLNVNFGGDFFSNESHWYRLCFACVDSATLEVALQRLEAFCGRL